MHVLIQDGLFVRDTQSGKLAFQELGTPTRAEVIDVARRTAERIDGLLQKSWRSLEPEADEPGRGLLRRA